MQFFSTIKILLLLVFLQGIICFNLNDLNKMKIESIERVCNLHSQYAKFESTLSIKNNGDDNVNKFYFTIPKKLESKLFLLTFKVKKAQESFQYKIIENFSLKQKNDVTLYEVTLNHYIPSHEKLQIFIEEQYYNRMIPFPTHITLMEDQLVRFEDNVLFYSPYVVESQKIVYKMPSTPISFTEKPEVNQRGGSVEYGLFKNIAPFSVNLTKLHFENNTPFVVFKKVVISIEVSHWGNIVIDGSYKIANEGALLTGEYGRVDYSQYKQNSGKSALKSLNADLPYNSWGVYYTDEIGNISTSNAWRDHSNKEVKIELRPRFAIFGGWKSNWHLGYNLPMHNYLYVNEANKNEYTLKQFFGLVFEDIVAEDYELKVILPEGATEIKSLLPFDVDDQYTSLTHSYLDVIGRPTLIFKKRLVCREHYKQFMITYKFEQYDLMIEPSYLFAAYFLFFIVLIVLGRAELASLKMKKD